MKKNKFRSKKSMSVSLALVAGFVPYVSHEYDLFTQYGGRVALRYAAKPFVPFDPDTGKFETNDLKYGLYPVAIGAAVHYVASKAGINRMIARAGIPFIRI
jgi:hypothetical protein